MPRAKKQPKMNAIIDRMVKRIVKQFDPEQVILFGSHARGEAGPDSDVDLLIVMPVVGDVREKGIDISVALHCFSVPIYIIVTTPDAFAWRKDIVGTIEWPASKEGKVLYARTRTHRDSSSRVDQKG